VLRLDGVDGCSTNAPSRATRSTRTPAPCR